MQGYRERLLFCNSYLLDDSATYFGCFEFKIENFGLSPEICSFVAVILEKYVMRAGPQLGVDAYGVRRCGSVMPVCKQPVATLTLQTFAKVFLGRRFFFNVDSFTRK